MTELSIIKLLLNINNYKEYNSLINIEQFPKELQPVYSVLNNYMSSSDDSISVQDLSNLFFASYSKDKEYYTTLFNTLSELDVKDSTTIELINGINTRAKLKELSLKAYEIYEGNGDLNAFVTNYSDYFADSLIPGHNGEVDNSLFISDDIVQIVDEAFKEPGLRWRLTTMNKMLGSLRFGDFGFIFARPETGKTTFLASELTFMAEQAKGPVLWLANEEDGRKVMLRLYQATFGIDLPTLMSDLPKWRARFQEKYEGRLKVVSDMSVMTKAGVEKMCDKLKPALLVVDQLSKIGGFSNDRKDLELGAACEWGRTMAKTYAPVVAVHQADGTAEGIEWLNMNHVSNAKTAMQAEADWILGIGCKHKEGYETIRYLHLSKNKLIGDPDTDPLLRHGKAEVLIEPAIGRYKDLVY